MSSKPWHEIRPSSVFTPFWRRFTDERARDLKDTIALYKEVREEFFASRWSAEDALPSVLERIKDHLADYNELTGYLERLRGSPLEETIDRCILDLLALETTIFTFPDIRWDIAVLSLKEQVDLRRFLRSQQHFLANADREIELLVRDLGNLYSGIMQVLPDMDGGTSIFRVPLLNLLADPPNMIDAIIGNFHADDSIEFGLFAELRGRLYRNVCEVSGQVPDQEHRRPLTMPNDAKLSPDVTVEAYLKGTPILNLLLSPVPFQIPESTRFEHMHILAGTGHGKTQTLQHLILSDLQSPAPPGMVIIDSQGDMIGKLSRLALFEGVGADGVVIIDPRDIEHPPALNMFDVNMAKINRYGAADREQILNGIIELYEYFFGSLLGAELTQKQSLIFRYLARLMINIPGATIRTMIELMDTTIAYQPIIDTLPESTRMFFDKEFGDRQYKETKTQIKRRLYGIIENQTFERMFSAPKNRVDIPAALNAGKIVLVNTAKDFLKGGSSILGRYFIALTLQAALERAAIPENQRRPAFLYIDEAAEYFDDNIDNLLIQARKYKVGMVMAHQYLDQLANGLRASIAANTSIKFAGGVSDRDARSIAADMRTTPSFILDQRKGAKETHFACYLRNVTDNALSLSIPFGTLEKEPAMSDASYRKLIEANRARVSGTAEDEPIITLHHPDLPWELDRDGGDDPPKGGGPGFNSRRPNMWKVDPAPPKDKPGKGNDAGTKPGKPKGPNDKPIGPDDMPTEPSTDW